MGTANSQTSNRQISSGSPTNQDSKKPIKVPE
jgi:hypothetical protein